jgi:hypothetical protein
VTFEEEKIMEIFKKNAFSSKNDSLSKKDLSAYNKLS